MKNLKDIIFEKLIINKDSRLKTNTKISDLKFDNFLKEIENNVLYSTKHTNQDIKNLGNAILTSSKFDKDILLFSTYNNDHDYMRDEVKKCIENKTLPIESKLISLIGVYKFYFLKTTNKHGIIDMMLFITNMHDKILHIYTVDVILS